jgi:hypothetical protein
VWRLPRQIPCAALPKLPRRRTGLPPRNASPRASKRYSAHVLGIYSIVIELLLTHPGTPKLFGWPTASIGAITVGTWP